MDPQTTNNPRAVTTPDRRSRNEPVAYQLAVARAKATVPEGGQGTGQARPTAVSPAADVDHQAEVELDTDPELQLWSKKALRMVLTAPGMSLADVYRFNSAIMFYPQPLYDGTMSWTAQQQGTRFGVPVYLLHGDTDPHTLTSLVEEYYPTVEAPAKNLVLLPAEVTAPS